MKFLRFIIMLLLLLGRLPEAKAQVLPVEPDPLTSSQLQQDLTQLVELYLVWFRYTALLHLYHKSSSAQFEPLPEWAQDSLSQATHMTGALAEFISAFWVQSPHPYTRLWLEETMQAGAIKLGLPNTWDAKKNNGHVRSNPLTLCLQIGAAHAAWSLYGAAGDFTQQIYDKPLELENANLVNHTQLESEILRPVHQYAMQLMWQLRQLYLQLNALEGGQLTDDQVIIKQAEVLLSLLNRRPALLSQHHLLRELVKLVTQIKNSPQMRRSDEKIETIAKKIMRLNLLLVTPQYWLRQLQQQRLRISHLVVSAATHDPAADVKQAMKDLELLLDSPGIDDAHAERGSLDSHIAGIIAYYAALQKLLNIMFIEPQKGNIKSFHDFIPRFSQSIAEARLLDELTTLLKSARGVVDGALPFNWLESEPFNLVAQQWRQILSPNLLADINELHTSLVLDDEREISIHNRGLAHLMQRLLWVLPDPSNAAAAYDWEALVANFHDTDEVLYQSSCLAPLVADHRLEVATTLGQIFAALLRIYKLHQTFSHGLDSDKLADIVQQIMQVWRIAGKVFENRHMHAYLPHFIRNAGFSDDPDFIKQFVRVYIILVQQGRNAEAIAQAKRAYMQLSAVASAVANITKQAPLLRASLVEQLATNLSLSTEEPHALIDEIDQAQRWLTYNQNRLWHALRLAPEKIGLSPILGLNFPR